ncbi:UDP-glucose 4-epimerase [Pseudofrankia sp. DC12]|uniref:UDP-glucose 4-epimerase n=1 Tax=Pseudofrankia sp. DC12 TaxID=683315 RepID=UPI000B07BB6B|nr:UDP-glucose 4-epimerase [Pseudofrankia sp. DC12]
MGTGGYGRELLDVVEAVNAIDPDAPAYRFLGFLDEQPDTGPRDDNSADADLLARRGASLLGGLDLLATLDADYLIGVGSADARARIDRCASAAGRRPATLVHPRANLGGDVKLGPGTVVCALASLTTNISTGRHVLVDVGSSVAHDCRLGDYATVAPGARVAGGADIGARVWVGSQATVVRQRKVGEGAVVGAGAVVVDDVAPELVVVGVPARPIASGTRGWRTPAHGLAEVDTADLADLPPDDVRPPTWPPPPRHEQPRPEQPAAEQPRPEQRRERPRPQPAPQGPPGTRPRFVPQAEIA